MGFGALANFIGYFVSALTVIAVCVCAVFGAYLIVRKTLT